MTTDDRTGDLLPFPHVTLPPSFDAAGGAPPEPAGTADGDTTPMIPVGSWPALPDVADMAPPLHMTVAGVPKPESGEEGEAGAFVPPPPADPDSPRSRDAAVLGMAVVAAVGVACAQGMWQLAQGARARAEHRKAVADKARTAADTAADKAAGRKIPPGPEYGRSQKAGGGRSGGGSGSGSGSGGGGKSGGGGGGSKVPASLRSNGAANNPKKGPDTASGSRSGGLGPKGQGGGSKSPGGAQKGSGGGSGSGGGKGAAGRDGKGQGGGWKRSPDGPVAKENAKARNQRKAAKQNADLADRTKDRDQAREKQRRADKDARRAEKDKAREKSRDADPAKDKGAKDGKDPKAKDGKGPDEKPKPQDKPEAKTEKADAKVDLTKKPKTTQAGKDKAVPPKPTRPPKPLYDPKAKVPGAHKPDGGKGGWKSKGGTVNPPPKAEEATGPGPAAGTGAPAGGTNRPDWDSTAPPPPPPFGMPGMDGMRPPPAYTDPEYTVEFLRPPEEPPRGAAAALAAAAEEASAASSTPPGPAAPAVPPQRGARFVSAPAKRPDTQYRDAELTIYDVIDADADTAEEITAGVDEARAAADGCERLVTKLEALHAKVVEMKVPGSLEGMVLRLIEKTGEVKAKAEAIAAALPRASEAIATAGSNAEAIHRRPADVTRDMGHTRPADREYNME
ncbi:hypothetical protein [Streptomyces sp. BRB081]|uniref:hypothetical protein n=1 Tax=Streptomyces sp. BRB081 TaxID=2769544 RepID=UPI0018AC8E10|nr:hypothetical protein [Streptomyces sp. BRB081]MBL3808451.1 hypothetical protein [Streptomyces sp. BRB081]